VFAAEAQPHRLTATQSAQKGQDGRVVLTGVKPWCSLAGQLDCALVTAHGPGGRQVYRVSLREPTVTVDPPVGPLVAAAGHTEHRAPWCDDDGLVAFSGGRCSRSM
jgi:alkylation response protein AidB-like acyl-CoA dehydrogenase